MAAFGQKKRHAFLVRLIPGLSVFQCVFFVDACENFLLFRGQLMPSFLVHEHGKGGGISTGKVLDHIFGHFSQFPAVVGFDGMG